MRRDAKREEDGDMIKKGREAESKGGDRLKEKERSKGQEKRKMVPQ